MSWAEKLKELRAGMTEFEVVVTKTYRVMAKNAEHAQRTIEGVDDRGLSGLLRREHLTVNRIPDADGVKP